MNLDKFGAMKLARTLAKHSDLTITFEETSSPRTNGKTLFLELPKDFWGERHWTKWWGAFYHETGHNDPAMRDCFTLIKDKDIDMSSFFGFGLNVIEDNRQERYKWDDLIGRRNCLSRAHILTLKMIVKEGKLGDKGNDEKRDAIEALFTWDNWERQEWMLGMGNTAEEMYNIISVRSQKWVDALKVSRFVLKDTTDAESVYTMWKGIIDEIFKFNSDEEEKKANGGKPTDSPAGGKQGDGEGEGSDTSQGEGEGSGEGDAKAGQDPPSGPPGEGKAGQGEGVVRMEDASVNYDDLLKHKHEKGDVTDKSDTYGNLTIKYSEKSGNETWISKEPRVRDYVADPAPENNDRYRSGILAAVSGAKGLTATVRRLLQIRSRDRYQYGQKKGKLHGASLHRLGIKNGGAAATRVFKTKRINECLDVSFTVLGDSSGSMGTTKYVAMAASMMLLNRAVQPLGVDYELLSFTDMQTSLINIFKQFHQKVSDRRLLASLIDAGVRKHNNADGEAIMWAYSRLLQQKTARKVLVVLSDGQPASSRVGDCAYHTKTVIQSIEKAGDVEIYGVGIQNDSVKTLYKDYQVIKEASELERALLNLIQTRIIK